MARYIGINKSLLAKYIYGIKRPSEERMRQIKQAMHTMGEELVAAVSWVIAIAVGIPAAVVATRQSSSELGIVFAVPKV